MDASIHASFEARGDVENGRMREPTEQPYGARECAFSDPAGNHVRIQQLN